LFFHCIEFALKLNIDHQQDKTAPLKDTTTSQALHLFSRDLYWYNGILLNKAAQICATLL